MGDFLKWLIGFPWRRHKWVVRRSGPITRGPSERIGTYYELQCEKCGNMKVSNLK